MFIILDREYRKDLRIPFNLLAEGVALTKMQRRICLRLSAVYYDKLKRYFRTWAANTFANYAAMLDAKKARAIDRLFWASLTKDHKAFKMWVSFMWAKRLKEHGDRIKAWYVIQ